MCMDIFIGIGKFFGYCGKIFVGYVKIYLCMKLWEFFLGMWKFFLFAWLWKNLVVVRICDKFGSGDILMGY